MDHCCLELDLFYAEPIPESVLELQEFSCGFSYSDDSNGQYSTTKLE